MTVEHLQVRRGKPAPDVYIEVLSRLGCSDPSQAMVIEDAVHGLVAAKDAGAFGIGISNSLPPDRLQPNADLVISHISEIRKFIPGINSLQGL